MTNQTLAFPPSAVGQIVPQAHLCYVTPTDAAKWLENMPRNRGLSVKTVELYASDMAAGRWTVTGEAVKFDKLGHLIDGQHRLHAVIQSGATVPMFVVFGLDSSTQDVMDTGRKRTAADAATLNGYPHAVLITSAARLALNFEAGMFRSAAQQQINGYTNSQILDWVLANPDIHDAAQRVSTIGRLPMKPSVSCFCLLVLGRIDAAQADSFFDDVANLRTEGKGDPRFALINRFNNAKDTREFLSAVSEAHLVFRTWNALRSGEKLTQLKTKGFDFQVPH